MVYHILLGVCLFSVSIYFWVFLFIWFWSTDSYRVIPFLPIDLTWGKLPVIVSPWLRWSPFWTHPFPSDPLFASFPYFCVHFRFRFFAWALHSGLHRNNKPFSSSLTFLLCWVVDCWPSFSFPLFWVGSPYIQFSSWRPFAHIVGWVCFYYRHAPCGNWNFSLITYFLSITSANVRYYPGPAPTLYVYFPTSVSASWAEFPQLGFCRF